MSAFRMPPAWRLPEGVDRPLWQYAHTPRLAAEEDAYFSDHPLFRIDARILDERFTTPGRLVDLGCGAGRHALRFASRGFTVAAVDLSRSMLEVVGQKACAAGVELLRVEANLCRLGGFPDATLRLRPVDVQHAGDDPRARRPPAGPGRMVPHPPTGRPAGAARA